MYLKNIQKRIKKWVFRITEKHLADFWNFDFKPRYWDGKQNQFAQLVDKSV